jgi:hypothetical protein
VTRIRLIVTSAVVAALVSTVAAQSQWYALYDEAVKHIQAGEFQLAETKLLQAKKDGPASGRNVLRYGSLRAPYFPDYYLGVVYVSTNRPQEALDAFTAARGSNIDAKNNEFKLIGTFEGQARTLLANAKNNPGYTAKPGPGPGPVAPTGPDPAVARAATLKEFDTLLATARQQLEKKNFDGAEQSANNARALSDKQGLGVGQRADQVLKDIGGNRQLAVVEDAVNRKDPAAARAAWNLLNAMAPTYADPTMRVRIERLEKESTPTIPVVPANTNTGANAAASAAQFDSLFNAARTQFGQRNFEAAAQSATNASRYAIKQGLGQSYEQRAEKLLGEIDGGRRAGLVQAAVGRKDAGGARRELNTLRAVNPGYDVTTLERDVSELEKLVRVTFLERDALRAFYLGKYQESLQSLTEIDRLDMRNARSMFYRACGLASLAAASADPSKDPRLTDAKKSIAEALKQPDRFKDDLRYISPKVRQLLGI